MTLAINELSQLLMTTSMAPMRMLRCTLPLSPIDCLSSCVVLIMCSAYSSTFCPAGVSDTPLESRRNNRVPSSSSSAAIRLETDAWVVNIFSAVRRKLFRRATHTRVSRNFRFTAVSNLSVIQASRKCRASRSYTGEVDRPTRLCRGMGHSVFLSGGGCFLSLDDRAVPFQEYARERASPQKQQA